MKLPHFALYAIFTLSLVTGTPANGSGIEEKLATLTGRIQNKINAGKRTEADLAPELKEIEILVSRYSNTDAEAAAKTLVMKATLYHMVLQDEAKSVEILQEIVRQFPNSETALKLQPRSPDREDIPVPPPPAEPTRDTRPPDPEFTFQSELRNLKSKIQNKFSQGRRTPAEYSSELAEFDSLAAKYGETDSETAADALLTKAILYQQVFQDQTGAKAIADQITPRFPHTQVAAKLGAVPTLQMAQPQTQTNQAPLVVGSNFPHFEVPDLNGEPLSVTTRPAKFVLVNFWATTSIDCVQDLPKVLALYKRYQGKGFEIVGISLDTDQKSLTELIKEFQIPWPQHFSPPGSPNDLGRKFGIGKLPSNFLLDSQGKILATDLRGAAIEQAVADAFAGRTGSENK